MRYEDVEKLLKHKPIPYKMRCLKWHQRVKIFFSSWYTTIKCLPIIITLIRANGK